MEVVRLGSIITRSDGNRYIVLDRKSIAVAREFNAIPLLTDSTAGNRLIGKRDGDSFYDSNDTYRIEKIEQSGYANVLEKLEQERKEKEKQEKERVAQRKRELREQERLAKEQRKREEAEERERRKWEAAEERKRFEREREIQRQRMISAEREITALLSEYRFQEANELAEGKYENIVTRIWFLKELSRYRQKRENELRKPVEPFLKNYDFAGADRAVSGLTAKEYNKIKAEYVGKWFEECVSFEGEKYTVDPEQALAIADMNKNTLVAARAGSGKTRTIVAKIVFLISKYNISPDEILAFVFNNNAAKEINERLEVIRVDKKPILTKPEIATTFHAFSRKIVYSVCEENEKYGKILAEDKDRFVQAVIKKMPKEKIYNFFRNESFQIRRNKFESEEDYFRAIRNSKYETLDGKVVKSEAEKIICDFLLEHDIKYYYENDYYVRSAYRICKDGYKKRLWELVDIFDQESIKPDFYLVDYDLPWEHWAISGNESESEKQKIDESGAIGSYDRYKNKMLWKQWFFQKNWIDRSKYTGNKYETQFLKFGRLIETYKGARQTREEFEQYLKRTLESRGVKCVRLPQEKIIERVWDSQVKRFSRMITQFIDRAEQEFFDNFELLDEKINNFDGDSRVKAFLEIGRECYKNYLLYLSGKKPKTDLTTKIFRNKKEEVLDFTKYGIDFNLLLVRAIKCIRESNNDNLYDLIANKKYIMIDEYQDFSRLFYTIIGALREICSSARLFAVGDDWQAINRFAGSDVNYFINFRKFFGDGCQKLELTTNYRSDEKIVENARTFVTNAMNESSNYRANSEMPGRVILVNPKDIIIDYTPEGKDDIFKQSMMVAEGKNPSKAATQYLKAVVNIIKENKDSKDIMILHRNNDTSFWFISLEVFRERLKKTVSKLGIMKADEFDQKVSVLTMHRAKGLEADTVIILEADDGIIPSYHQDTHLFEIFGESEKIALDDQKRLFYVAITRAKKNLYILHNEQHESRTDGFISYLDKSIISLYEEPDSSVSY